MVLGYRLYGLGLRVVFLSAGIMDFVCIVLCKICRLRLCS